MVSVENGAVIVLVLLEVVVVLMVEVLVLGSTHFTPFDLHLSAFLTKMEIKAVFRYFAFASASAASACTFDAHPKRVGFAFSGQCPKAAKLNCQMS